MTNESKTLFIPLHGKAAMSREGFFRDKMAEQIVADAKDSLQNVDTSRKLAIFMAMRAMQYDEIAAEFAEKHNYLIGKLKIKGVTFNYHDNTTSAYEAVFARGDRRTCKLLYEAHKAGCKFDGWSEHFKPEAWEKAFEASGIDRNFYTTRERSFDEILPWDLIDSGVSKKYLINEAKKAVSEEITNDCRLGCVGCGINRRVKCEMDGILGGKNE